MAYHADRLNVAEPEAGAALVKPALSADFTVVLIDRPRVVYQVP
jgi:hypothetical protein